MPNIETSVTHTTQDLMPCPFCGGKAESGDGFAPAESIMYAYCSNLDCELHSVEVGFTPESWNRRATLSGPEQDTLRSLVAIWRRFGTDSRVYPKGDKATFALCADELEAALSPAPERVDAWPARYFASGPDGEFFANNHAFAEATIKSMGFDRDEWTVTDLSIGDTCTTAMRNEHE